MGRLKQPERHELNEEQSRIYDEIVASRGSIEGPFLAWLQRPTLADRAQKLGEYIRYHTRLEPRLSELAILVTARFWNCQVEWTLHEPFAIEGGLGETVVDAVRCRRQPEFADPEENCVYDFAMALLNDRSVSDATFEAASERLGTDGIVDLTGLVGYYSMVAMTLNACQVPLPKGRQPLLVDCPTFR